MLPLYDGYKDMSRFSPSGLDTWLSVLLRLEQLLSCPNDDKNPGWAFTNHNIGVLLVLPSTSEMSRQWRGSIGGSGEFNYTGLNLIEIS